jgi:dihydrofolate synthase/folylpolyglutamate synthase
MTNRQFLDWLASLEFFGIKLGLDQTRALFLAAGSPERDLKFIHVAGSNGKGSVCAMIESGLRAAGFRTGFYSSPHLVSPCERFRINGKPVSEDDLCAVQDAVMPAVAKLERNGMKPTYFEVTTLIAALLFSRAHCEYVVWEVGMGGRLDATNIVTPLVSAITGISLEHTHYLGDTVRKIAGEKAGIIKPGVPVYCSSGVPGPARNVIGFRAAELDAPFRIPPEPSAPVCVRLLDGGRAVEQRFTFDDVPLTLRLAGPHQRRNAALAFSVLRYLADLDGFNFAAAIDGLRMTVWQGRFDLHPEFGLVLDGAHNPEGIGALAETLREVFPGQRFRFIFGAFSDKDTVESLRVLAPLALEFVFVQPESDRPSKTAAELESELARIAPGVPASDSGLSRALESLDPARPTVLCGSLHLCGDVLAHLGVTVR